MKQLNKDILIFSLIGFVLLIIVSFSFFGTYFYFAEGSGNKFIIFSLFIAGIFAAFGFIKIFILDKILYNLIKIKIGNGDYGDEK